MNLAFIGGTGNLGFGLAMRCALEGHRVLIGSRDQAKAQAAADKLVQTCAADPGLVSGLTNQAAAEAADLVVLSLPYSAQPGVIPQLQEACRGKIVLDTTVPMQFGRPPVYVQPPSGSAAQDVQQMLPQSKVLSGLHTVSAASLAEPGRVLECHALLCGGDQAAKETVIALFSDFIPRIIDVGGLEMAQSLERLTPLIVAINQRHKRKHVGIRLTNI